MEKHKQKKCVRCPPPYRKTKQWTPSPAKSSSPQWAAPQCSSEKEKHPPPKKPLQPPLKQNHRKSPFPQLSPLSHLPGCSPVQNLKTDYHQIHPKTLMHTIDPNSTSSIPNCKELLCSTETEELSIDVQLRRALKPLLNFKKIKEKIFPTHIC